MDSLSHIIIGAAIGEAMLGRKIGRKAALVGALAKTIPDFDLFYTGLEDPWLYLCHHRGHTHSLLWETLYAIPLAYLFFWLFRKHSISYSRWLSLFLICLYGHSLLDVCTNYGTRLFLPITEQAFAWNTISIVDLFFTVPMLLLFVTAMFLPNFSKWRSRLNLSTLLYCLLYIGITFIDKYQANTQFEESLDSKKINYTQYMTNPVILQNFLWYGIAVNDSDLYIAENSLLFPKKNIQWTKFKRNQELMNSYPNKEQISKLRWFSNGYDLAEKNNDSLQFYAVKFGRTKMDELDPSKSFVFHYKLYQSHGKDTFTMYEPDYSSEEFKQGLNEIMDMILGRR